MSEIRNMINNKINNLLDQTCLWGISAKERFLNSIKSSNSKYKYSRVVTSPIRYPGGKSLAVGYVVELFPESVSRVISPFFGGGSVEIALSKYFNVEVVGYDIFDILVNYWRFQIERPGLLYDGLKELNPDQNTYHHQQKLKFHL